MKPAIACVGAAVRLASLDAVAAEFLCSVGEMESYLGVLRVRIQPLGDHRWINIHALELALARLTDPEVATHG